MAIVKRKWTKKRRFYKKKKTAAKKRTVKHLTNVKLGLGFPMRVTMTHKYRESVLLTSTTGAQTTYYEWSTNSLYDPNATGTGHQPQGFDYLTPLYDHYTVIGSKIHFEIVPLNAAQVPFGVAFFINDDTASTTQNIDRTAEQSFDGNWKLVATGSNETTHGYLKWSARREFGKGVIGNSRLIGTSGTSPSEQSYFTMQIQSVDQGSTVACYVHVSIEYIAVWTELKDVPGN